MKHWLDIVVAQCVFLMVMGCQLLNPGPSSAACEGEVTCDISELRERGCEMRASRWLVVGGEVMLDAFDPFDRGVLAVAGDARK